MWWKCLFAIMSILLGAACSPAKSPEALWNTPQATPVFVSRYNNIPITEAGTSILQPMICVKLDEGVMVEAGDTPNTIETDIKSTAHIEIDGQKLSPKEFLFSSPHRDGLLMQYTTNGNYMGSYVSGFTVCISTHNLTKGFHLSKLEFSRTSGKTYSFSWAFKAT